MYIFTCGVFVNLNPNIRNAETFSVVLYYNTYENNQLGRKLFVSISEKKKVLEVFFRNNCNGDTESKEEAK